MTLLSRVLAMVGKGPQARLPMSVGAGFVSQLASSPTSMLQQLESISASGWIFACVDRIASAVAATQWHLYQQQANGDLREILRHPFLDLWHSVNPFSSLGDLLEVGQQHMELTGETWWVVLRDGAGKPAELWPIRPDRIRPVPSRQNYIAGYLYTVLNEAIPLRVEDVVFIRRPHPVDPYRGLGVVENILADISSEQNAAKWVAAFYKNSAEPGGIIEFEESLSDADFERIVARWKAQHQGVSNAHRVAIIEKGKWHDRLYTQRDMQFTELRRANRDIILGAFGIPRSVLGIVDDVNRANAEAGEVTFTRWVLLPRLRRIAGTVTERLLPQYGPGLVLDFEDPTPLNREQNLSEAERGYRAGVLTKNEARRRLGEDDVEGGEDFAPPAIGPSFGGGAMLRAADPDATELYGPPLQRAERRMERAWAARLHAEVEGLIEYLNQFKAAGGAVTKFEPSDVNGWDWGWWVKYGEEVTAELLSAFRIALAQDLPTAPLAEVQRLAGQFAEHRGARLLKLDGPENLIKLTQERVNTLVAETLREGEGLGKLAKRLREDMVFSRQRATMIARTETATALGQGAKESAIMQGRDQKHWVTQGDDLVSELCRGNEAAGWIGVGDTYPSGHDTIPGHPACRCVGRYRTKALHEEVARPSRHTACGKLLMASKTPGQLYCRHCKAEV